MRLADGNTAQTPRAAGAASSVPRTRWEKSNDHAIDPETPVYMVSDEYRPDEEISARSSGATMYFCKPLQSEWLLSSSAYAES